MHYYDEDSYQSDASDSMSSDVLIDDPLNLDSLDEPKIKKKRIREKLDHLSHEEKLMRRKMKNRVSAQSARDRKRKLLSTLEKKIEVLCKYASEVIEELDHLKSSTVRLKTNQLPFFLSFTETGEDRQKILKENAVLKRQNDQIIMENSELKKRLSEIESRLSSMSRAGPSPSAQLPVQINSVQTTSISPQPYQMNNPAAQEPNGLRADVRFTSFKPAAFISGAPQKNQDVQTASAQKKFSSKTSRKVQSVRNKELIMLIKQLISLFMMMKTNATTCSTSSKTATKICLTQTLRRLRQLLTKPQMSRLLTNVINRLAIMDLLKMEHIQKFKSGLGKRSSQPSSHYQKSV